MRLRLIALSLLLSAALRGQSIAWDPPGGQLVVGRTVELDLVCRDCQPTNDGKSMSIPSPPSIPGLAVRYETANPGTPGSGVDSEGATFVFFVNWSRSEALVIPAFDVATDHGVLHVPEARFEPVEATVGPSHKPLASAVEASLEAQPAVVWAGQVFAVDFRIDAAASYDPKFAEFPPAWPTAGITAEDWGPHEVYRKGPPGNSRTGMLYRTRAVATHAGEFELQAGRYLINLSVGMSLFGIEPGPDQGAQFSVPSRPFFLTAKPLPPAPPGFAGAVGQFSLSSRVAPREAAVSEPITWTVELSGTGNWPRIQHLAPRAMPPGFHVVHPQVERSFAPGKLFEGRLTEDAVLVPSRPGRYELPAVSFVYFDPTAGEYRTLRSQPEAIAVTGSSAAPEAGAPAAGGGSADLEPPRGLLGDPLPPGGQAPEPLTAGEVLGWSLAPAAALLAVWIAFAVARAREEDPERPRREAWRRQRARLERIAGHAGGPPADAGALRRELLAWQRDAAIVWRSREAAPDASAFSDPAQASLWAEADAAIFGPAAALPADWGARADRSHAAAAPPRFQVRRTLLARNLWPLALVAALAAARPAGAASPASAYASGQYAAAAAAWRLAAPRDAAARHNLSLALAQQGLWPEAAGEAAAAFVQRPAEPAMRRRLAAACDRAAIVPGPLAALLQPGSAADLGAAASPAVWQRVLIAAAWAAAAAAALLLGLAYGRLRARWIAPGAAGLLALAVLAAGAAGAALRLYGPAANPGAVWVLRAGPLRSIPTDADAAQATVPLAAGAVAIPDKTFLGWIRLRFPDGSTGWIRRSEVLALWK